jgi:twitching motility protein PilT
MITSPGIREAINDPDNISEIYTYIEKGKKGLGTQSFDQHITDLYKQGKISMEEAKANATSSDDFERNLMFNNNDD